MIEESYKIFLGLATLLNFSFSFILTIEICEAEDITTNKKIIWILFAWLIPVVGPIITHTTLSFGWAKGNSDSSNDIIPTNDS
ncbi:PLDc N-terminal domain-containing protein [Endozoicomonas arenosclerae]|uniref:PLDc N-terminal domain-containing protein n=1 Tax=Endozoicomonas arenosclerae TaxID=1633495 RepID=UPI0007838703|nr:PLDc N-terminal domain-containing protein [Endozoicomonas arenosclerae]